MKDLYDMFTPEDKKKSIMECDRCPYVGDYNDFEVIETDEGNMNVCINCYEEFTLE